MLHTIYHFGYLGIFITIILETGLFAFPLPADSLLFAAGIWANVGKVNIYTVYTIAVMGSIIGGHLGYFIGKKYGKERIKHNRFFPIDEDHFHKAEMFFAKYGPIAILVSRFVPIVRTFISPTLGIIGYDKYKFAMYNAFASFLWPTIMLTIGYYFGRKFPKIIDHLEFVIILAVVVVAAPFVFKAATRSIHKYRNR